MFDSERKMHYSSVKLRANVSTGRRDAAMHSQSGAMDTKRLLGDTAFEPDDIVCMTSAYNLALHELGLIDRDDPLTETVARRVIEIMLTGERDPVRVCEFAVRQLRAASVLP